MRHIDEISGDVLDVALRIHRDLGPGLLESVYETVLAGKLGSLGYDVCRQRPVSIEFEGMRFEGAFRIDLLVDERLLVEIKSVGLLLNFGGATLKEGVRRIVNDHQSSASPRLRVNQPSGE